MNLMTAFILIGKEPSVMVTLVPLVIKSLNFLSKFGRVASSKLRGAAIYKDLSAVPRLGLIN